MKVQTAIISLVFFKNSCPGNDSSHEGEDFHIAAEFQSEDDAMSEGTEDQPRRKGGQGGNTCCVPECFSNSKRDPSLSFYSFPDGKSDGLRRISFEEEMGQFGGEERFQANAWTSSVFKAFPRRKKDVHE